MNRVTLLLVCLLAVPAAAAPDDLFARANKDYSDRNYEAAIAKYEELVKSGTRHESLCYNLGNAYFRSAEAGNPGRLGRAILAYERALAIEPGFEDARYNLEVARDLVGQRYGQDKVKDAAAESQWTRIVTYLPLSTVAWTFFILDLAFFAVLIALRFLPTGFLRTGLVVFDSFVGVALLLAGALLGAQVHRAETVRRGIIVADEVVMREGPDPSRKAGPTLHAGHGVVILHEDHGWLRLRLANDVEQWVPAEAVDAI